MLEDIEILVLDLLALSALFAEVDKLGVLNAVPPRRVGDLDWLLN
jgi:hypothetical protein